MKFEKIFYKGRGVHMNTSKVKELKVGQVFKNYKELVAFFDEEVKNGGTSKKAQLENFKRYFDYEKQGNKFIITEIKDVPTEKKLQGKDATYGIELDALFKNSLGSKRYTNRHLYTKLLPIVDSKNNEEFFEDNASDLTLIYNCNNDDSLIQDYRSKMLRTLTVDIDRSLNRLAKNDIITCEDIIVGQYIQYDKSIIANPNEVKYFVLTDSECNKVEKFEREAREELNATAFQVSVNKATRRKFDEIVRFKMESLDTLKGHRIIKYWKAIEITRLDFRLFNTLAKDKVAELLNVYTKDLTYRIYASCVKKLYDGTFPFGAADDKLLDLQTKIAFLNDCLFINETTELDINFFDREKIVVAI